ncbi:MAG: hypothetical protein KUL81_14530 [Azonexus sp.]|nr:hypothetical protein [Azonexus sp.]
MPLTSLLLRSRRCLLLACLSAFALAACSQQIDSKSNQGKKMTAKNDVVYFDVALFSYLDRPIFDVYLNGRDIGVAAGQPHRGEANGLMTGVAVPLGTQIITWRDAGTGEKFKATNTPVLKSINSEMRYLGVHIYPDNTVEVIPERFWPEKTEKGQEINRQWELKHGK